MRARLMATSFLMLCLAGPTHAQDAVTLRYKLAKGDQLRYRNVMEMSQTQKIAGQTIATKMTIEDRTLRTVDNVDGTGNMRLNVKNEILKVSGEFAGQKIAFDSESDEQQDGGLAAQITPLFERLSGSEVKVELSPAGNVRSVKGYLELIKDIVEANPIAAQFANAQSGEAINMNFQESYPELSQKAVKPGDTWEIPFEVEMAQLGKIKGKKRYEFIAPDKVGDRSTMRIQVTPEMSFDLDIESMGAKITGKFATSSSSGTVQFDASAGRLVSMETSITMSGDFVVTAGGQNIPLQIEQTQNVKVELVP